jgi:hypothetical protein
MNRKAACSRHCVHRQGAAIHTTSESSTHLDTFTRLCAAPLSNSRIRAAHWHQAAAPGTPCKLPFELRIGSKQLQPGSQGGKAPSASCQHAQHCLRVQAGRACKLYSRAACRHQRIPAFQWCLSCCAANEARGGRCTQHSWNRHADMLKPRRPACMLTTSGERLAGSGGCRWSA